MAVEVQIGSYAFTGTGALSSDFEQAMDSPNTLSRSNNHGDGSQSGDLNVARWISNTPQNDQFSIVRCNSLSSWTRYAAASVRNVDAGTDYDSYEGSTDGASTADSHTMILEVNDGSDNALTDVAFNFDNGDLLKTIIIGTNIYLYHSDDDGASWTLVSSTSDSTYASGRCGCGTWGAGEIIDDFAFGNIYSSITPGVCEIALTGYAPTVIATTDIEVTPGVCQLQLTGYPPTVGVSAHVTVQPGVCQLTLTGYAPTPTITEHVTVTPGVCQVTLTGYAPTVTASDHKIVEPGVCQVSLTGYPPTAQISDNQVVNPGLCQVVLTGYPPMPTTTGNQLATPGVCQVVLTGYPPTISVDHVPIPPAHYWRRKVYQGQM
jgi:hypothetical protein